MFRPEISRGFRFFFFFPLFLLGFSSCGTAQVLGNQRDEAAELLRNGKTDFILQAELASGFTQAVSRLRELNLVHPAASFYAALLIGNSERDQYNRNLETLLFCAALDSPLPPARREAARKLIPRVLNADTDQYAADILALLDTGNLRRNTEAPLLQLRAACLFRLGRYDEIARLFSANPAAEWGKAISLFAAWKVSGTENAGELRSEILAFLFQIPPGELRRWAFREALALEGLLNPIERAVILARLSGSQRIFLASLPLALSDGGLIFLRHPELITDLGRAFQNSPAMRGEGAELFQTWNRLLETGESESGNYPELSAFINSLDSEEVKARKHLLLFHTGHIERARGRLEESTEFFARALDLAPNAIQSDAAIRYMLLNAMARGPSEAVPLFLSTIPRWDNTAGFVNMMDNLSSYLANRRQWNSMLEIFLSLETRDRPGASFAQYAWILGRAVEEGLLYTDRSAESFFRAAFEERSGSFYNRTMAASRLGLAFSPVGNTNARERMTRQDEEEVQFILGFFECGAASLVLPYLRAVEDQISVPGLRKIAEAFTAADNRQQAHNLILRYSRRENFEFSRQDLYLFHPRHYRELVEKYAREMGIEPEILFGLIRTESLFRPDAISRVGAIGLTQLMPATAAEMAGRIVRLGGPDFRGAGIDELKDPETNIHIGSFYLRRLIELKGNPMLALVAYNGGMGRVRRWRAADQQLGALPVDLFIETIEYHEPRRYGRWVLAAAAVYGYLYYGRTMETVAADIFR